MVRWAHRGSIAASGAHLVPTGVLPYVLRELLGVHACQEVRGDRCGMACLPAERSLRGQGCVRGIGGASRRTDVWRIACVQRHREELEAKTRRLKAHLEEEHEREVAKVRAESDVRVARERRAAEDEGEEVRDGRGGGAATGHESRNRRAAGRGRHPSCIRALPTMLAPPVPPPNSPTVLAPCFLFDQPPQRVRKAKEEAREEASARVQRAIRDADDDAERQIALAREEARGRLERAQVRSGEGGGEGERWEKEAGEDQGEDEERGEGGQDESDKVEEERWNRRAWSSWHHLL